MFVTLLLPKDEKALFSYIIINVLTNVLFVSGIIVRYRLHYMIKL
jgi:hypothetical protein